MISTTLLGVAFCSCDFALRCPIPGWVAVETGTRKPGGHGRFRSGVVRRDSCDRRARRERPRIQRPPHPPVDVARSTGVVANLSGNCDCIRCWVWAFGGISMSVEYLACYVSNEALSIDDLFVFLFTVSPFRGSAQQKVLLLGIVLALAARTGFIDSRRVMTPDAAGDDRHRRIELLGQAHQARGAVGPTRRRGYDR
jgi:hypothetical protein